jgi:DNA-binding MarR family transcriptional regulator
VRLPSYVQIRYLARGYVPEGSANRAMPRPGKTRQVRVGFAPCEEGLDLNSHIATKVAIFANRLSRSASRFYRKRYGIGVVEWRIMMFIGHAPETRANRICRETDLDKGAVSRSLRALARMGIVSVREDGADSRRNNVALTAKGRVLHDRLVPVAIERQRALLSEVTPDEVQAFSDLIDRLQANVADGEPVSREPRRKRQDGARPHFKAAARRYDTPRRQAAPPRG